MKRAIAKILLVVLAVGLGWGILSTAPRIAEQYRQMRATDDAMAYPFLGIIGIGSALVLSGALYAGWLICRELANPKQHRNIETMTTGQIERETKKRIRHAEELQGAAANPEKKRATKEELRLLERKSSNNILEVIVFGAINGGKSSLLNALCGEEHFGTDVVGGATTQSSEVKFPGKGSIILRDTPGLQELFGERRALIARGQATKADIVIFVVADDLRDFELDEIKDVASMPKRVLVCFNKRDRYTASDASALHKRIVERLDGIVAPEDVIPTQAIDVTRMVDVQKPDGTTSTREDIRPRDISSLTDRLLAILDQEGHRLLLRTMLQRARELDASATQPKS